MGWTATLPLLALPVAIFNALAFASPGGLHGAGAPARLAQTLLVVPMHSGAGWSVTLGDLLVGLGLIVFFVELLNVPDDRRAAIVSQSLSTLLFGICLVEFLLWPAFASSSFVLVGAMVLLDVIAGFIVSLSGARRAGGLR